MSQAKDWVLLANFQDFTLMTNAIAMKAAQKLGMPYTNTIIPVDLTLNGEYRGSYMLTQQVEVHENRINVGPDGVLLEMDALYDEPFKFMSAGLQLPVMFKYPANPSAQQFQDVKADFDNLGRAIVMNSYDEGEKLFDRQQVVNYILLNSLVGCYEIKHPKSVFIHKAIGGKYMLGPVWDFDWAFGYNEKTLSYFGNPEQPLLVSNDSGPGAKFLNGLLKNPETKKLFKKTWQDFKVQHFNELLQYVETYAARIRVSKQKDFAIWKNGSGNLPQLKADMKTYLHKRSNHLDAYVKGW